MASRTLEFFFDLTSPYSYLAATQVEGIAQRTGAELRYRPFALGAVFKATGNSPPLMVPAKGKHMLKDLQDWVRHYGLPPLKMPAQFPFRSIEANRLALVALEKGKGRELVHHGYAMVFAEGRELSDPSSLLELARRAGLDAEAALTRIEAQEIKDALRRNTDDAVARGAYGAPTFFVGDEMFVGNDRLAFVEKALTWV